MLTFFVLTLSAQGKTTLARLLYRFMRAYGVLTKDIFLEKNGMDMKGEVRPARLTLPSKPRYSRDCSPRHPGWGPRPRH